jgi:hypothetical protein
MTRKESESEDAGGGAGGGGDGGGGGEKLLILESLLSVLDGDKEVLKTCGTKTYVIIIIIGCPVCG